MRALIVGGGIGGLTAAIALRKAGIEVTVYEREDELRAAGAALTLWTNAMNALDRIGLAGAVDSAGARIERGYIRSWRGDVITRGDLTGLVARYGAPCVCVHRADLQRILLAESSGGAGGAAPLPGSGVPPVTLGARCVGVSQDADGVTARFDDGSEAHGDVLVGADGIHSAVRQQLVGNGAPRYAGQTVWRGVVAAQPSELPPGSSSESWGRGARFGMVHCGAGRVYWFAVKDAPEGEPEAPGGRKDSVLRLFRGWHKPIESLVETTDEAAILRNDIFDRPPIARWGEGRATLLGDAAHPTTPNLGQGACQAIEDALVLARNLRDQPDSPEAALRAYERERIPRANAVTRGSWRMGGMAQLSNPILMAARNAVLRLLPPSAMTRSIDWLLRYDTCY